MKEGKKNGVWTYYYLGGKKLKEMSFIEGKENGPMKEWFENGDISVEGEFENGEKSGKWIYSLVAAIILYRL